MLRMIFIFIDGFGIGEDNPNKNPIIKANTPTFDYIMANYKVHKTDACLGIEGLPQSATGQASLYTGVNVSKIIGRHISARPTKNIIKVIERNNIFKSLIEKGNKVTFSNIYSHEYIDKMKTAGRGYFSPSVTSIMNLSANLPFRMIEDYKKGNGVYHDIRGEMLKKYYDEVELTLPEEAGVNLYNVSRDYNLTLFEYFMTDLIGHKTDMDSSVRQIEVLDRFLCSLLANVNLNEDIILITSDHGNIEDVSVKTHTMNDVPTVFITNRTDMPVLRIESLLDIYPAIMTIFEKITK